MPKRTSIVRDISWDSEDTRGFSKSERDDFIGKCNLIYPAFIKYLKMERKDNDQSHDVIRRKLYDTLLFRDNDNDIFKERVLNAIVTRAFDEMIVPEYVDKNIYSTIIKTAQNESEAARELFNKTKK